MIDLLKRVYQHRTLLQILVMRDLKVRYRGTAMGFMWSFLNPLVLMTIYSLVFSVYMRVQMQNYAYFLLCGLLPWNCFAGGIGEGTNSILSNGGLIRKVNLPSEIFPLVTVCSNVVHYLLSVPILILFALYKGVDLGWPILLFPVFLVIQIAMTYGCVLFTSATTVQFRDMLYIVPNVMMMFMFLTPIFYSADAIPEKYALLQYLNPLTSLMQCYRSIFFLNRVPDWHAVLASIFFAVGILAFASTFFEKRKEYFAELV